MRWKLGALVAATVCAVLAGCSPASKTQYYMVVEPQTGERAIYKLTLDVTGFGAANYKLSSGYVPAYVVDALTGDFDAPADLFAPGDQAEQQAEAFNQLRDEYLKRLKQLEADKTAPGGIAQEVKRYSALLAAAALSREDLISIGEQRSYNPYEFRKLVYFTSTEVVKIGEFTQELDAINDSAVALAKAMHEARQAKTAAQQARADEMRKRRGQVLGVIQENPDLTKWTGLQFLQVFATLQGVSVPGGM